MPIEEPPFNSSLLEQMLPDLISQGLIIYAGAGISMPPPTCAPSWWQLTEEILQSFFDRVPKDWGLPTDLIIKSEIWQPEVIFENFANIFDTYLYKVFEALDVSQPNGNHRLIAKMAKVGYLKACITTNFDMFLERALNDEGVNYELLVENTDYNAFHEKVNLGQASDVFVLCKVHGTIEKPGTIVSVASAYKSAKGFSTPKALVIAHFLRHFPCLFLGYSGWDFEHNNYRKFWEQVGPHVKGIYWNRRIGEVGGPNFHQIFRKCLDKFQFTEADLPDNLIRSLHENPVPGINPEGLSLITDEGAWEFAIQQRLAFFHQWATGIQDSLALVAVINNGVMFSAKLQDYLKNIQQVRDEQIQQGSEMQAASAEATKGLLELYDQLKTGVIDAVEYQSQLNAINEKQVYSYIQSQYRVPVKDIVDANKYPGYTDDEPTKVELVQKMKYLVENGFAPDQALTIALERIQCEREAAMHGEPERMVEAIYSQIFLYIVRPEPGESNALVEELSSLKSRADLGELSAEEFRDQASPLQSKFIKSNMGNTIPLDELFSKLLNSFNGIQNAQDLLDLTIALNLAVRSVSVFFEKLVLSPEYSALRTAAIAPTPDDYLNLYDPVGYQSTLRELQEKSRRGEVSGEEFSKKIQEKTIEQSEFYAKMITKPLELELIGSRPDIPREIIQNYDNAIRSFFRPVFEAIDQFPPEEVAKEKVLVNTILLKLWNISLMGLDMLAGSQMLNANYAGKYPLFTCNPAITAFLAETYIPWVDQAFEILTVRFGQPLCESVVDLAFESDDLDLCTRATQQSLNYSEGIVNESTPANIPSVLAQMLENRGDRENALKFFKIALEGIRNSTPPAYSDVIVYRSALLSVEKGDRDETLKIIGLYHPDFFGKEGIQKVNARLYAKTLAEDIAKELGYSDLDTAISDTLQKL